MTSLRNTALAVGLGVIGALTTPAAQAAPEFVNGLALDGALPDKSGGKDTNNGRVGYFSDLYYDANKKVGGSPTGVRAAAPSTTKSEFSSSNSSLMKTPARLKSSKSARPSSLKTKTATP